MRTDDLIRALAADPVKEQVITRSLLLATLFGGIVSIIGLVAFMGVREDLIEALATWRFDVKLAVMGALLTAALVDALRRMRPIARSRPTLYAAPIALLLAAILSELMLSPSSRWSQLLVGTNSLVCLAAIPLLSLTPLAAILVAMRRGAPSSPSATGACAGCLAASIGAFVYGLHCVDDSPLFVATWYTLAILPVIGLGALAGRGLLRW